MTYLYSLLLLAFLPVKSPATFCSCELPFETDKLKAHILSSNFVFEGKPIKTLDYYYPDEGGPVDGNFGPNVLFLVEKVFKGDLNVDTVAINQYGIGNCAISFYSEENYIISADQIHGYEDEHDPNWQESMRWEVTIHGTLRFYFENKKYVDYWNSIKDAYPNFDTSSCISFSSSSWIGKAFKNE